MHDRTLRRGGRYRLHPPVDDVTRRRVGDANPRGSLERPEGPFRLRDGLVAPGDLPFDEALTLVSEDWARQTANGTISAITVRYTGELRGLGAVLVRLGQPQVRDITANAVLMWMKMPKADGHGVTRDYMGFRRSAARSFFQTAFCLGLTDANPAKVIELPERSDRYVHPFTDAQIAHLKRVARTRLDDTRTPATLALVLSGAATGEVPFVTIADVDLPRRRVWVHGGGYRLRDRWIPLDDDWCLDAVTRRIEAVRNDPAHVDVGDPWLVYRPHPTKPTRERQQASLGPVITGLLKSAGLHQPGVTRAESIREWLAARVFAQTGSVEAVAVRLGMSSLDTAAHLVGYDWVQTLTTDQPPAHRTNDGDAS